MRGLLLAALAAPLLVFIAVDISMAQRRGAPTARPMPPLAETVSRQPITRFRARTEEERRQVLRTLNVSVRSAALGPSFVLTPRNPYIAGRGALATLATHFNAYFDTTGFHLAQEHHSSVSFHLIGMHGRRAAGDCAVSGADGVPFAIIGASTPQSIVQNGRLQFVTPPIAQGAEISIRPSLPVQAVTPQWIFTGCEFTLLGTAQGGPAQPVLSRAQGRIARTVDARLATLRRVGAERVRPGDLGPSFSVTPRDPFVPGRGFLMTNRTDFDSEAGATGRFDGYYNAGSAFFLVIEGLANNKLLVDCAVVGTINSPTLWDFHIGLSDTPAGQAFLYDGFVSFVTPQLNGTATITLQNSQAHWRLTGCEITPLPG
jgi:hypothetical protein